MKFQIECTPLIVERNNFTDKKGNRVDYAIITFTTDVNGTESSFTATTKNQTYIDAMIKGKGKKVSLPFAFKDTEYGLKISLV